MMYNTKNYTEQGGEKTVIGGTLTIEAGATLEIAEGATVSGVVTAAIVDGLTSTDAGKALSAKQGKALKDMIDALPANPVAATTTVEGIVKQAANVAVAAGEAPTKAEFDALIAALVAAGVMAGAE